MIIFYTMMMIIEKHDICVEYKYFLVGTSIIIVKIANEENISLIGYKYKIKFLESGYLTWKVVSTNQTICFLSLSLFQNQNII